MVPVAHPGAEADSGAGGRRDGRVLVGPRPGRRTRVEVEEGDGGGQDGVRSPGVHHEERVNRRQARRQQARGRDADRQAGDDVL